MTVVEKIYANPFGSETRAKDLFEAACRKGAIGKLKSLIMQKKHTLLDNNSLTTDMKVASSHYLGKRKVAIDRIKASKGRCEDFDLSFHPLKSHNQQRWIGIACVFDQGIALPPVELIKIGEVYAVRDGHHRISVAKAFGASAIEAYVTEMEFSQSLGSFL